jgi:hypothetical protein
MSLDSFAKRAKSTEKRAKAVEKATSQLDRYNPQNRQAFRQASVLRSAADRYSSVVRRAERNPDLTVAQIARGTRYSTAPKLTPAEKAKATKAKKAAAKQAANIRAMEQARRWG